ncbi:lycopene beta cyclase, chloroplastic/chromoplastic-like [Oryza brachyantha]|uniref:lycopene beta cyclase, chloroplastic/chromoplastic-like n=1 Tax=Oryza brachyantha TaxID=4533 RepID=UPI001ADC5080|nr:lycopene beta cyclase, chloroplastic/chromoplastic-like [Oryza brachyantha]
MRQQQSDKNTLLLLRALPHPQTHHPAPARASSSAFVCRVAALGDTLWSLAPPARPELLSLDLPRYDPALSRPVDLAVAQRVAKSNISVSAMDPSPALVWPNNYDVWVDEFKAMGLSHYLNAVWPSASVFVDDRRVNSTRPRSSRPSTTRPPPGLLICDDGVTAPATVVLDATGFSRCLVQYDKPYNPGYQVAFGILAEVDEHPFNIDKMLFMDWRDEELVHMRDKYDRLKATRPTASFRVFVSTAAAGALQCRPPLVPPMMRRARSE